MKVGVCITVSMVLVTFLYFFIASLWWSPEQSSGWEFYFPWLPGVKLQQQPQLRVAHSEPPAHQFLHCGADRRPTSAEPSDL